MINQVSLFFNFLTLLSIFQTKESGVVSSRAKLFFRSGKPQKSPSLIVPLDFEHPQHSVETEPTSLMVEQPTHELTDLHHEPLHPADSHHITEIDSHDASTYELDWDPIANDPHPNHEAPDHLATNGKESLSLHKSESGGSDSKTIDVVVKGEIKGDEAIASNHQDHQNHQDHKTSYQDQETSHPEIKHQEIKHSDEKIQPETKGDANQAPVKEHHHGHHSQHHHGHDHDQQDGKPEAKDSHDLANTEVKEAEVKEIKVKETDQAIATHEKDPHPDNPDQKHHDEVTTSETKVAKATTEIKGTGTVVKADPVAPEHQETAVEVKGETGIKGKDAIVGKPLDHDDTSTIDSDTKDANDINGKTTPHQTDEQTSDSEAEPEPILVEKPNLLSEVIKGLSTVTDPSGKLTVTWKFDGGYYEGQVGVVSIAGMENYDLNSPEFMKEAIRRALAHIIVDDTREGAEFSGNMGDGDVNHGAFTGEKTVQLQAGEQFFFVLAPNGRFTDILAGLEKGEMPTGNLRPLFSLATANPESMSHFVQLVDLNGEGTFALEDIRGDGGSDWDLNDIIISVKGANIDAPSVEALVESGIIPEAPQWMETDLGKAILESVVETPIPEPISERYDFPKADQPLVGFIDTHLTRGNPDINYSNITFGKDYVENDSDPTVTGGEGTHGDHVLGIVGATQDNGLGIDGINDDAPLWVSSAVESGKWAEALVEFVDAAIAFNQPNAIVNLSIDLTQINPDASVTTRYEFTPLEMAALEYARQNNVLVVVAAGNDGGVMSALGQSSQQFDNIITIGSAEQINGETSTSTTFSRAEYSSYGNGLDLMADSGTLENPVLSTVGDHLGYMNGTSVATAKVTGAASLVWAANPELNYLQVIQILKDTATDLGTLGWDMETGSGLLNIAAAVHLAQITKADEYNPTLQVAPISWSGEGQVIPMERAVRYLYVMKDNETLWGIAQRDLGNGTRWTEITKDLGGTISFTNAEATKLPVGQVIYLPGNNSNPPPQPSPEQVKQTALNNFLKPFGTFQSPSWLNFLKEMFEKFYNNPNGTLNSQAPQVGLGVSLTASPNITPTQSTKTLTGKKIILDPGHGIDNQGYDPGASGNGTTEAVENLYEAKLVAEYLRQLGASVTVLDEPLSLAQIGQRAAGYDIFVSLHQNSFNSNAQGHEVYSHPSAPAKDAELAKAINSELDAIFPDSIIPNRGVKTADFSVLRNAPTSIPAVLVESLFIDAPGMSRANIDKAAIAVARGIEKFFTGKVTGSTPTIPIEISSSKSGIVNSNIGSVPLNFRAGSDTGASIIGTLSQGTSVKILKSVTGGNYTTPTGSSRNDWYQIEVNGKTGYVAAYYIDVSSTQTTKPGYVDSADGLNFRTSPSASAGKISLLSNGTNLTILEKVAGDIYQPGNRTDWYKVQVGNTIGYVAAYYVKEGTNSNSGGNNQPPLFSNPTPSNPLRGFSHPLRGAGSITQGPNGSTSHSGRSRYAVDYGVDLGTAVYAMRSGKVVDVRDGYPDTGGDIGNKDRVNWVVVEHDGGYRSAYLHLQQGFSSKVGLKKGDLVSAGQLIGYSGNSGWSTGPHLHVEINRLQANGFWGDTVPFVIG